LVTFFQGFKFKVHGHTLGLDTRARMIDYAARSHLAWHRAVHSGTEQGTLLGNLHAASYLLECSAAAFNCNTVPAAQRLAATLVQQQLALPGHTVKSPDRLCVERARRRPAHSAQTSKAITYIPTLLKVSGPDREPAWHVMVKTDEQARNAPNTLTRKDARKAVGCMPAGNSTEPPESYSTCSEGVLKALLLRRRAARGRTQRMQAGRA